MGQPGRPVFSHGWRELQYHQSPLLVSLSRGYPVHSFSSRQHWSQINLVRREIPCHGFKNMAANSLYPSHGGVAVCVPFSWIWVGLWLLWPGGQWWCVAPKTMSQKPCSFFLLHSNILSCSLEPPWKKCNCSEALYEPSMLRASSGHMGEDTCKGSSPVLELLAEFCLLVIPTQGPHM